MGIDKLLALSCCVQQIVVERHGRGPTMYHPILIQQRLLRGRFASFPQLALVGVKDRTGRIKEAEVALQPPRRRVMKGLVELVVVLMARLIRTSWTYS